MAERDHGGSSRRNCQRDPVEGLAKERAVSEKRQILLGALVAADLPCERSEPHTLAAGEDDAPESERGGTASTSASGEEAASLLIRTPPGPPRLARIHRCGPLLGR